MLTGRCEWWNASAVMIACENAFLISFSFGKMSDSHIWMLCAGKWEKRAVNYIVIWCFFCADVCLGDARLRRCDSGRIFTMKCVKRYLSLNLAIVLSLCSNEKMNKLWLNYHYFAAMKRHDLDPIWNKHISIRFSTSYVNNVIIDQWCAALIVVIWWHQFHCTKMANERRQNKR